MENAHRFFDQAIEAIDTGNLTLLKQLLNQHPQLVRQRHNNPDEGYFKNPYLLWFIADNPIRHDKLPANIVAITNFLIETARKEAADSFQYQIEYTLGLVCTGRIPRECGVQLELIDLLIDAGAAPGNGHGALANGNLDAASHLVDRGGELTLATAIVLDRMEDIKRLSKNASPADLQVALMAAAFYGKAQMIKYLIELGAKVNGYLEPSSGFHSHASPLHQAVFSGSLESVAMLTEAGADLNAEDRIHHGTPLGWAMYMQTDDGHNDEEKRRFAAMEALLKTRK